MRLTILFFAVLLTLAAPARAQAPPTFLLSWSPPHAGSGSASIAVDGEGTVYVLNLRVEHIQKFDANGEVLAEIPIPEEEGGNSQASRMVISPKGDLYLLHYVQGRVTKRTRDGAVLLGWGSSCNPSTGEGCLDPDGTGPLGPGDGQFFHPADLDADHLNRVFVLDPGTGRVQVFDAGGVFLTKWVYREPAPQLSAPDRIAVDSHGTVTVWIDDESRLARFTAAGRPLEDITAVAFDRVAALDTDADDNLYVSEFNDHRVFQFDAVGALISGWGSEGGDNDDLRPSGVAVDDARHLLYVLDYYLVQKFAEATVPVEPTTWGRVKTTYD